MRRLTRLPLRIRLTAGFAVVLALLLGAVGTFVFLEVKDGLNASLDATLRGDAALLARRADGRGDERVRAALAVEGEPAQLVAADGRVLAASPRGRDRTLIGPRHLRAALRGEVRWERDEASRLLARPAGAGRVIVVQAPMAQRERALETLGRVLLIAGPLILLLASGAGYLVAALALRSVERMRRRAALISAAGPTSRLPLPAGDDELRRLGETLNAMLARLEESAAAQGAFLAHASHELRTPLAILRTEVELALDGERDPAELRAALASVGEEAERLTRLATDLLVLARADDGKLPLRLADVELAPLAARVAARFRGRGEVRTAVPDGLVVRADALQLEQALTNLVDNGLDHGAAPVTITARAAGDGVELHVVDDGHGFTAQMLPQAFTRLASGQESSGFGLGLSIVEAIAIAHGGRAGAGNGPRGADVWLQVPAVGDRRGAGARRDAERLTGSPGA